MTLEAKELTDFLDRRQKIQDEALARHTAVIEKSALQFADVAGKLSTLTQKEEEIARNQISQGEKLIQAITNLSECLPCSGCVGDAGNPGRLGLIDKAISAVDSKLVEHGKKLDVTSIEQLKNANNIMIEQIKANQNRVLLITGITQFIILIAILVKTFFGEGQPKTVYLDPPNGHTNTTASAKGK
jgi:hypothetical protein